MLSSWWRLQNAWLSFRKRMRRIARFMNMPLEEGSHSLRTQIELSSRLNLLMSAHIPHLLKKQRITGLSE